MKTRMFKVACVAIVMMSVSVFSSKAQSSDNYFFDKKYENEQVVSATKYELGDLGLYEKTFRYEYAYNESGNLVKKEVFKWNGRKDNWEPVYCILGVYNQKDNTLTYEYSTWNKKKNTYNAASQKADYQMNILGEVVSAKFSKDINGKLSEENITYVAEKITDPTLLIMR